MNVIKSSSTDNDDSPIVLTPVEYGVALVDPVMFLVLVVKGRPTLYAVTLEDESLKRRFNGEVVLWSDYYALLVSIKCQLADNEDLGLLMEFRSLEWGSEVGSLSLTSRLMRGGPFKVLSLNLDYHVNLTLETIGFSIDLNRNYPWLDWLDEVITSLLWVGLQNPVNTTMKSDLSNLTKRLSKVVFECYPKLNTLLLDLSKT